MYKHKVIVVIGIVAIVSGCATTKTRDFEKPDSPSKQEKVVAESTVEQEVEREELPIPASASTPSVDGTIVEKIVYVEKPIYYPADTYKPATGVDAVRASTEQSQMLPANYNGRIISYDYDESMTYHVYCQPLRITDIYLEPGETIIDQPYLGDSARWILGYGKSLFGEQEVQHIYLKPTMAGLETTLSINTTRRIYYFLIKSYPDTYMGGVKFRFPQNELSQYIIPTVPKDVKKSVQTVTIGNSKYEIDPSLISTDYKMRYPGGKKTPAWLPTLVLDDGKKTYIYLPDDVEFHEAPALFMDKGEIVNYRQDGTVLIIDRLVKTIYLKLRDVTVTIEKKGS